MAKKAKAAKAKKGAAAKGAKKGAKQMAARAAKEAPAKAAAKKKGAGKRTAKATAAASQPPRPVHGNFMWNELMTRGDTAAVAFFGKLLGWTCEDMPMGPGLVYRVMKNKGVSIAGIMQMSEPAFPSEMPPNWTAYIAVDDVDKRYSQAKALGGEGVHPPTDIPMVGRFCIIRDPTGAPICLMTPEGGVA